MTSRRARRGYTMIEVMVALTIVLVGSAGVITMQRATIQGNVDARRMDLANAIARAWVERLRADSMLWTLPAARNPADNFANAPLLQKVANVADATWFRPDQRLNDAPFWSPGMNVLGADVPQSDLGDDFNRYVMFCTNVRLTWLIQGSLMRADVRVYWPRGVTAGPEPHFCAQEPDPTLETMTDRYHFVYATTAIRRNSLP